MKIAQRSVLKVEKDGKLVELYVDSDLPLGLLFDALMEMKGYCVERMSAAHAEESEEAERQMEAKAPPAEIQEKPLEPGVE